LLQELCGSVECSREPLQVIGGHNFQDVDAGFNHTCAVTASSLAYCWGGNRRGELGTGSFFGGSSLPEPVGGGHLFSVVSVGTHFSCGLTLEGAALCWGSGESDAIGTTAPDSCPTGPAGADCATLPMPVETQVAFVRLAAGDSHVCALSTTLQAHCWGDNAEGQLGAEGVVRTQLPQLVPLPVGMQLSQLSAAASHTCAVATTFSAYCWGGNRSAQLGIGVDGTSPVAPTRVMGEFEYESISAGGNPISSHTCALSAASRAFCWGSRDLGQVGGGG
jgi:alpha-tubulin suppressor-like RCC1 family protein